MSIRVFFPDIVTLLEQINIALGARIATDSSLPLPSIRKISSSLHLKNNTIQTGKRHYLVSWLSQYVAAAQYNLGKKL